MRNLLFSLTLGLPICLPLPAMAEEPGSGLPLWLSAVGDFIQSGIEPPRTLEDLLRQEEEERQALLNATLSAPDDDLPPHMDPGLGPEPGPELDAEPDAEPAPAAVAAPVSPPISPTPAPLLPAPSQPGPVLITAPTPQPAIAPPPPPQVTPPPALPMAPPTLPSFPPAEPISPAERIAGTATLDQALKLGGPADLYANPIRRPTAAPQ